MPKIIQIVYLTIKIFKNGISYSQNNSVGFSFASSTLPPSLTAALFSTLRHK